MAFVLIFCVAGALAATSCTTHTWGEWKNDTVVNLSCGMSQPMYRVCSECGRKELTNGPTVQHSYSGWTTVKQPTCTEAGAESRTCSRCHATETRSTAMISHSFTKWEPKKAATCTETGLETRSCVYCGFVVTRDIEAKGHPQTDVVLHQSCAAVEYGCPVCRQVIDEVRTGNECEQTDVFLGCDRLDNVACFGCPVCGTVYGTVDLSGLGQADWSEWTWNGNGTHSRYVISNPVIIQTEPCFPADEEMTFCEICKGEYFREGVCVALTDIPLFSTLDHVNDDQFESTILCYIPAGATYLVNSTGEYYSSVTYNGVDGYIARWDINYVFSGTCTALADITLLSTLDHTNDELYESTILCTIPAGATYYVTDGYGDFAIAMYNGMTGYIGNWEIHYTGEPVPEWTDWENNGNGTHSRHKFTDPSVVQTESCYVYSAEDVVCPACKGAYFHSGTCVALNDIIMLSTLDHTNDEQYESTILCTIPAGATFYVTENNDFATVTYNGMEGYINGAEVNFVDAQ